MIDSSGSIQEKGDNWPLILAFVKNVIGRLNIGSDEVRVAAIRYSREVNVEFYLDQYSTYAELYAAVDSISHANAETNTAGAISMMTYDVFNGNRGDRPDAMNIGIVITDGESNVDPQFTVPYAVRAQGLGIRMIAVGVTNSVNLVELRGIASPGNNVIRVQDFSQLDTIVATIAELACEEQIGQWFAQSMLLFSKLILISHCYQSMAVSNTVVGTI